MDHTRSCVYVVEGSPAWLPELAWRSRSLNARLNFCFCVCVVGMVLQASTGRQRPGAMVTWCQTTSWWEGWCALARKCVHVHACIHTQLEKTSMLTHNTILHVHNVQMANIHFQNRLVRMVAWKTRQIIGLKKALNNWLLQHYNCAVEKLFVLRYVVTKLFSWQE